MPLQKIQKVNQRNISYINATPSTNISVNNSIQFQNSDSTSKIDETNKKNNNNNQQTKKLKTSLIFNNIEKLVNDQQQKQQDQQKQQQQNLPLQAKLNTQNLSILKNIINNQTLFNDKKNEINKQENKKNNLTLLSTEKKLSSNSNTEKNTIKIQKLQKKQISRNNTPVRDFDTVSTLQLQEETPEKINQQQVFKEERNFNELSPIFKFPEFKNKQSYNLKDKTTGLLPISHKNSKKLSIKNKNYENEKEQEIFRKLSIGLLTDRELNQNQNEKISVNINLDTDQNEENNNFQFKEEIEQFKKEVDITKNILKDISQNNTPQ